MLKVFTRCLTSGQNIVSVREKVLRKLQDKFGTNLIHAEVNNLGWKNNEPKDSDKFLEVIVVTTEFESVIKSKRSDMIQSLLKEETKDSQVTYKLLTPSKWYDSNLRGLKLNDVYSNPPVLNGKLREIADKFYQKNF